MPTDPRLETYLTELDRNLGPIPVSERADIITEIKSHVLEAQSREGKPSSIDLALAALGEPRAVASRYLLERGLKPDAVSAAPRRSFARNLVIGVLVLGVLFWLSIAMLIWKVTPLVQIDGSQGRIKILGGVIDIKGDMNGGNQKFKGEKNLDPAKYKLVRIRFADGKISLHPSGRNRFAWNCQVARLADSAHPPIVDKDGEFGLELGAMGGASCEIDVPAAIAVTLQGTAGSIEWRRPHSPTTIELTNGNVALEPDPSRLYRYDFQITNARIAGFDSSNAPDAIPIILKMANGAVSRL